jgi:hypothetical protein
VTELIKSLDCAVRPDTGGVVSGKLRNAVIAKIEVVSKLKAMNYPEKTLGEPVTIVEPQSIASPILQRGMPFAKTVDEPAIALPV